jgi:uncharacterized protein YndB with AHSA1/START domain
MAAAKTAQETTVQIRRTFNASRERVYNAWTKLDEIARWFAPTDDFETIVDQLDVREGGTYRIIMRRPDGNHTVTGQYLQVQPPAKLVYTWRWEEKTPSDVSQVTIEFNQRDDGTEVVLTQRLVDEKDRNDHAKGWGQCLDRLGRYLTERS